MAWRDNPIDPETAVYELEGAQATIEWVGLEHTGIGPGQDIVAIDLTVFVGGGRYRIAANEVMQVYRLGEGEAAA